QYTDFRKRILQFSYQVLFPSWRKLFLFSLFFHPFINITLILLYICLLQLCTFTLIAVKGYNNARGGGSMTLVIRKPEVTDAGHIRDICSTGWRETVEGKLSGAFVQQT